jgi:hypothetical protein
MELIKEEDLNFFIFVSCQSKQTKTHQAAVAVIKAMLFSEGAISLENINENTFVFSTKCSYEYIKKRLGSTKTPFLILDLGVLYDMESVFGKCTNVDLPIFNNIANQNFFKDKPRLKRLFKESVEKENFELAANIKKINNECK